MQLDFFIEFHYLRLAACDTNLWYFACYSKSYWCSQCKNSHSETVLVLIYAHIRHSFGVFFGNQVDVTGIVVRLRLWIFVLIKIHCSFQLLTSNSVVIRLTYFAAPNNSTLRLVFQTDLF
jgi:hypothetical protein